VLNFEVYGTFFKYIPISTQMNRTSNFLLRNGKLNFEIECILVKCHAVRWHFSRKIVGKV